MSHALARNVTADMFNSLKPLHQTPMMEFILKGCIDKILACLLI